MKEYRLKNALVHSGFKAFSQADFKKVSTNDIVRDAGVSKGLLFHYFGNKESFYITLYEMALGLIHRDMFVTFPFENKDFFERLKLMILYKSEAFQKHKTLALFIKRVHLNTTFTITKKRNKIYQTFTQRNFKKVFEAIDTTRFKSDTYLDEMYKVVTWTFNKITHDWEKAHHEKDSDEAIRLLEDELSHYVRFFKTFFYK